MLEPMLGLDLGTTTLGIAHSDSFGFVHGIETFRFDANQYIVARKHILELATKMEINEIARLKKTGKTNAVSTVRLPFLCFIFSFPFSFPFIFLFHPARNLPGV